MSRGIDGIPDRPGWNDSVRERARRLIIKWYETIDRSRRFENHLSHG